MKTQCLEMRITTKNATDYIKSQLEDRYKGNPNVTFTKKELDALLAEALLPNVVLSEIYSMIDYIVEDTLERGY